MNDQKNIPPRILLVDDEIENLKALERTLKPHFEVHTFSDPKTALVEIEKKEFAVVVSDQKMPGILGTEFLSKVSKLKPNTTRIILTAFTETKELLDAINRAEIYRYITKPWDNQDLITTVNLAVERYELLNKNNELVSKLSELNKNLEASIEQRTKELKIANQKLAELAMTDPLTKVLNRRAFSSKVSEEIERSSRYKHPVLFAMIDVDHFKHFNDMEGHVYGDEALRKIAQLFTSNLRKSDTLARYGGEEFIVMMPETPLTHGKEICERLRKSVEEARFQGSKQEAFLTISIGMAVFPEDGDNAEAIIRSADSSLYAAKESGRNKVMHSPHSNIPTEEHEESFFIRG